MTTWAIIPVKHLHESKQRLAHLLTVDERADLILRFLDNLIDVLDRTAGIAETLIVTADDDVIALANRSGVRVLLEPQPGGLNHAVRIGAVYAATQGATAILVLPADLPFVRVEDIEAMLAPLPAGKIRKPLAAICPDELQEGTNALLLAPPMGFTFNYGLGSFDQHTAEAAMRRRDCHVIHAPGLRFDLDTESDWYVYNGYLVQVSDE